MTITDIELTWDTMFPMRLNSIDYWNNNLYLNLKDSNKIITLSSNGNEYKYLNNNNFSIFSLKNIIDNVIINGMLFSIDNKKSMCRIFCLKKKIPIAIFGFKNINNPTAIDGFFDENIYHIFLNSDNSIMKYEIQIVDDKITELGNILFINFEGNIRSILIDKEYKKFYIANNNDLIIYNTKGEFIKSIKSVEPFKLKAFKRYIIYIDTHDDGNEIHILNRYSLNKITSFFSKQKMNIIDFTFDNNDNLYLINDFYLVSKLKLKYRTIEQMFYPLLLGVAAYSFLNNFK